MRDKMRPFKSMSNQRIESPDAPGAIGPYSPAVLAGDSLYVSGQIPLVASTGELVGPDIAEQTQQVLKNLGALLQAAGAGFEHVVKTTIYLTDLQDFAVVNQIYGECFSGVFPARATVQVAALPRGARVEMDAIARLPAKD